MHETMMPPHYGGHTETVLHPIVLIAILISGMMILFFPRRYVIIPLFLMTLFIPLSQRIVVAGLDFMIYRIMILFGWIRIIIHSERQPIKLNAIDKALILWVLYHIVGYTFLWLTWGAFINRLGFAYNALGIYFFLRLIIVDFKDINNIIRTLAVISSIIAVCMLIEQTTQRNLFSIFGGVPEITIHRSGQLRSQGPFRHPILAGMFGATLMPLFVALWWSGGREKKLAMIGSIAATVIVLCSASSGPLLAYIAGILGLIMWPFRRKMRQLKWGLAISIIALHMIMKAPVWALVARAKVVGASTGYHRYLLIDQFIKRFNEWWLVGTKSTDHWGWMMWDTVNQYVTEGTTSGLLALILFIVIISRSFKSVGSAIKVMKNQPKVQFRLWAIGAMLFAHVVAFFGIAYFDQIIMIWYLQLAMIASLGVIVSKETKNIKDSQLPLSSAALMTNS